MRHPRALRALQSRMTSPHLPPSVVAHFAQRMDAIGRPALKLAQARTSALYRDGGHSREAVPDAAAALAYAVVRMPATYAACVRAFDLAAGQVPDFQPSTLLDLGAGTGSATLAAAAVWPTLSGATLVEPSAALSALAQHAIAAETPIRTQHLSADIRKAANAWPSADLVTLSYVLAEQPEADVPTLMARIAASANQMIIVVEPGTPQGYARILAARDAIAVGGFTTLAPCPHANTCPLPVGDWCHFSVRLQRSAGHRALKDADVPFEDERFAFLAAARPGIGTRADARLLRAATIEKGFADLALCTPAGLETRRIRRRDAADYKRAKGLLWGDAV
jgi:ribosomal protein RSM22 (predicted rRNA methylase)